MELSGILLKKSEIKEFSDKFKVLEFYVDYSTFNQFTGQKYENLLKFQLVNKKIELLEKVQKGNRIKVSFAPRGRFIEKDGEKFYVMNLDTWKIDILDTNGSVTKPAQEQNYTPLNMEEDDLPF